MRLQSVLFFTLTFCANVSVIADGDLSKHIVRQESYWQHYKRNKLAEKLVSAPPEIIDYLTKDNRKNGWPNRPTAVKLTDEYRHDLVTALQELPTDIAEKINRKLTAILVVNDLGGSAYTENVFAAGGNPVAGFVVLDLSVLNKTANEWATWKERSPFQAGGAVEINAKIASTDGDNRKNALQYILLHEFGHIISIGLDSVVPFGVAENKIGELDKYAFTRLAWKRQQTQFVSVFDGKSIDRTGLRYYASEIQRLPVTKAIGLYRSLVRTNFPTLYAATNPYDDFAESFVTYVHAIKMKKPWQIEIKSQSDLRFIFTLCWQELRCQERRTIFENILEQL